MASPPRLCLGAFLKPDVTPVNAEALQKLEASGPMLVPLGRRAAQWSDLEKQVPSWELGFQTIVR